MDIKCYKFTVQEWSVPDENGKTSVVVYDSDLATLYEKILKQKYLTKYWNLDEIPEAIEQCVIHTDFEHEVPDKYKLNGDFKYSDLFTGYIGDKGFTFMFDFDKMHWRMM